MVHWLAVELNAKKLVQSKRVAMKKTIMCFLAATSMTLCHFSCFAQNSHSESFTTSKVKISIVALTERYPKELEPNRGALWIRFQNLSKLKVVVPLAGFIGKGIGFIQPLFASDREQSYIPACFSKVHYEWLGSGGKLELSGVYDISEGGVQLKQNDREDIQIPIEIPKAGTYDLKVSFDNRSLQEANNSFNMFQYDPAYSPAYVKLEDQVSITLKENAK